MQTIAENKINKRHYQKINELGMFEGSKVKLQKAATSGLPFLLAMTDSSEEGITDKKAHEKRIKFGLNEVDHEKVPAWYVQLLHAFFNPFIGILFMLACVSFVVDVLLAAEGTHDFSAIIILSVMIVVSAILRFWQEHRSKRAAEFLKRLVKVTSLVKRKDSGVKELDIKEIVPGDFIHLSAGDMVPADCRIVESKDLFVSESVLTGESMPVEKFPATLKGASSENPVDYNNICFMGTNVLSGTAMALVITTGKETFFGAIAKSVSGSRSLTSFDRGVKNVSFLLIRFMLIMVPAIFLINGITKGDWFDALLFGIAVAVGLTPEMLPVIVSANLAKGAVHMSRKKVIVKRINSIQNFGAMDVLCTDKTGTLTRDEVTLEIHRNALGFDDDEVLKWAYLNSFHQTGLKSLLDKAILEQGEKLANLKKTENDYEKIDEIPFDFDRRRMSVILKRSNGSHLLICKGAAEELLDKCSYFLDPDENISLHPDNNIVLPLGIAIRKNVAKMVEKLNRQGMRVLLVATKEFPADHPVNYSVKDEMQMTLTGILGFLDPAKPTAGSAIRGLQKSGVRVVVLTGDNEFVANKICKDVGVETERVILGSETEQLNDSELQLLAKEVSVFAKLTPMQKIRIVKALQEQGHTVGFLGDGINDAGALQQADVGISVDTATDIAKESADIILLEKDLNVLREGVELGRITFGNIMKYLKSTASSNFGNVFSILGASAFLPFLPMLPIHLLVQNLLYDISQISIPWDKMDKEYLKKPQKWNVKGIRRFILFIGPVSSIFDYTTFLLLFYLIKANTPEDQSLFQSGWFVVGLLTQVLIVHVIRTTKIPFFQSWAAAPVLVLTVLVMVVGIIIPFSLFGAHIGLQPLPAIYFPFLIATLLAYAVLTQFVKKWYIKKFNEWL